MWRIDVQVLPQFSHCFFLKNVMYLPYALNGDDRPSLMNATSKLLLMFIMEILRINIY